MGSVKFQTRNEYKGLNEWIYVTLSEERTIAKLIRGRGKLDASYYASMFDGGGIAESNGVFPFSEPVLVCYIDLDRLIEETALTDLERFTVEKLMKGYTLLDLEDLYGNSHKTLGKAFASACHKLKLTNDARWLRVHGKASFRNYYREAEVNAV